jgi:hypothetical protein
LDSADGVGGFTTAGTNGARDFHAFFDGIAVGHSVDEACDGGVAGAGCADDFDRENWLMKRGGSIGPTQSVVSAFENDVFCSPF